MSSSPPHEISRGKPLELISPSTIITVMRYASSRVQHPDAEAVKLALRGASGRGHDAQLYEFTKSAILAAIEAIAEWRKGLPAPRPGVRPNMKDSKYPELRNLWVSAWGLVFDPAFFSYKPDIKKFKPLDLKKSPEDDDRVEKALAGLRDGALDPKNRKESPRFYEPNAALFIDEGLDRGYPFVTTDAGAFFFDPRPGQSDRLIFVGLPVRGAESGYGYAQVYPSGYISWPADMNPAKAAELAQQAAAEREENRAAEAQRRERAKNKDQFISDALVKLFGSEAARDGALDYYLEIKDWRGDRAYDLDDIWRALLFLFDREVVLGSGGSFAGPGQLIVNILDDALAYDDGAARAVNLRNEYSALSMTGRLEYMQKLATSPHWSVEAIQRAHWFGLRFEGKVKEAEIAYNHAQAADRAERHRRFEESPEGRAAAAREAAAKEQDKRKQERARIAGERAEQVFNQIMAAGPNPWGVLEADLRSGRYEEMTLGGLAKRPLDKKGVIELSRGFYTVLGKHEDGYLLSFDTTTNKRGSSYVKFLPIADVIRAVEAAVPADVRADPQVFGYLQQDLRNESKLPFEKNEHRRLDWPLAIYADYQMRKSKGGAW